MIGRPCGAVLLEHAFNTDTETYMGDVAMGTLGSTKVKKAGVDEEMNPMKRPVEDVVAQVPRKGGAVVADWNFQ